MTGCTGFGLAGFANPVSNDDAEQSHGYERWLGAPDQNRCDELNRFVIQLGGV